MEFEIFVASYQQIHTQIGVVVLFFGISILYFAPLTNGHQVFLYIVCRWFDLLHKIEIHS